MNWNIFYNSHLVDLDMNILYYHLNILGFTYFNSVIFTNSYYFIAIEVIM